MTTHKNLPLPKFVIGEKVYLCQAYWGPIAKEFTCPVCEGKGKETAVADKSGRQIEIECIHCYGKGKFGRYAFISQTYPLTIGSIRIDTAEKENRKVSYMCKETGIGSGSIYYECNLVSNGVEAKILADKLAKEANIEHAKTHIEDERGIWRSK